MNELLLDAKERDRFAAWLEHEAENGKVMLEQFKKMAGPAMNALIQKESHEIMAALIIAKKLRSIEDMSVSG